MTIRNIVDTKANLIHLTHIYMTFRNIVDTKV
jgi:hypothetical protein